MTATLVFHSGPDPFEPWRDALAPIWERMS